ncbi:MAG: sugar phosphate isomerase/epimerase family protein [Elusimicrobiota bacterium]|nr:sugar phosphate isomerase/epimerase family protein [Elusimicrobiota bacterium]
MIALSTAYNISKHKDPVSLVEEIKSLGFSAVELNVEVPESFISEIAKRIEIVSVHNYCPKLDFIPLGKTIYSPYNIASTDENERTTAVKLTKKTIDVANSVGAEAIVIHAGEVDMEITGRALAKKYNETKGGSDYKNYLETFLAERKAKSKIFLENVLKSFDELIVYAERKNIKIGVENRFWANEIPSFSDYKNIFQKFYGSSIGLWYDVGHSIVAEKQMLVKNHLDFLENYSDRLIGVHLHDVIDVYDHKAPGTGDVNFTEISNFLNDDAIIVNETHSSSTKEDLKNSIEYLKNHGFAKFTSQNNESVLLI